MPSPPVTTHIETPGAARDPNAHHYIVWIHNALKPNGRRHVINKATSVCALRTGEAATLAVSYLADKLKEAGEGPADGTVYQISVKEADTNETWSIKLTYQLQPDTETAPEEPSPTSDAQPEEADPVQPPDDEPLSDGRPAGTTPSYAVSDGPDNHQVVLICQEDARGEGTRLDESQNVMAMGARHAAALVVESFRRRYPEMIPTTTGTSFYMADVTRTGSGGTRYEASRVELAYHAKRGLVNATRTLHSTTVH